MSPPQTAAKETAAIARRVEDVLFEAIAVIDRAGQVPNRNSVAKADAIFAKRYARGAA